MGKKEEYLDLLTKNYDEAVEVLLKKYGESEDDYFREKSYERFLNGEIKSIARGKYSRSAEGLECHHIDEDKFHNLTGLRAILEQRPPYKHHKKDRLVFSDVVEHAILHTLIAKETSLEFGKEGYDCFLKPKIQEWYIDKVIPTKSKHHIACYHTAYLEQSEAVDILNKMDNIIETERYRMEKEKQEKLNKVVEEGNYKRLNKDSTREELVRAMYDLNKIGALGYSRFYTDFVLTEELTYYGNKKGEYRAVDYEEFKRRLEDFYLDGVLEEIQLFIKYTEGELSYSEYETQVNRFRKTKEEIIAEQKEREEKEKLEKKNKDEFYSKYPLFKGKDINYDIKRVDINALLYKYRGKGTMFLKFQATVKNLSREELLEELHSEMKDE